MASDADRAKVQEIVRNPSGWHDLWVSSHTPWDEGRAMPALIALFKPSTLPASLLTSLSQGTALVPGCGSGHDVLFLSSTPGRTSVTGLDISPRAVSVAESIRDEQKIPASKVSYTAGDFFSYTPPEKYNLVYDHTFLCALEPQRRPQWAEKIHSLLSDGEDTGFLITYMFPISDHQGGPPYALSEEIYHSVLDFAFDCVYIKDVPPEEQTDRRRNGKFGEKIAVWKKKATTQ
ncbi:hypothetical protein HDU85_006822 [Gaertneriomyces sp. JEL0708]|nr:hypothetical protein HDU85_006822 [Gaertneriomyces sp. JEL0708]